MIPNKPIVYKQNKCTKDGRKDKDKYLKDLNESRKIRRNRLRNREYERLRMLVPSINSAKKVSKVDIINEAVRYIDHLQQQIVQKMMSNQKL